MKKRVKHRKRCRIFCIVESISQVVNFIMLNPFKVVKLKSCFILLRGIWVLWCGSQINAPSYTESKQTL